MGLTQERFTVQSNQFLCSTILNLVPGMRVRGLTVALLQFAIQGYNAIKYLL
jgi:hypothetical protein